MSLRLFIQNNEKKFGEITRFGFMSPWMISRLLTEYPRLISQKIFLGGGSFEGRAYSKLGTYQAWDQGKFSFSIEAGQCAKKYR